MYVVVGMWHAVQAAAGVPLAWCVWAGASYFAGRWHCAQTALPAARNFSECGSWQSEHVTPAACILLCVNGPQL